MPSRALAIACLTVVSLATPGRGADAVAIRAAIDRGVAYLKATGQDADGSFSPKAGPAVTALAVTALVRSGVAADDPAVAKAVAHLLTFRQADGGIHTPGAPVANYETAIAVMALVACNADGRHDREIATATAFLRALQWDEGEGRGPDDPAYGGAGYGRQQRPDLSNTQFFIDAAPPAPPRTIRRSSGRWRSCRARRTFPGRTTTSPIRPRTPTAASTTPRPPAARARRGRRPTAACAATAR